MPDKPSKKKTEIPQPRPDIILPDDLNTAAPGAASPQSSQAYQQAFQGRCTGQGEP